jgi:hypothetical protein
MFRSHGTGALALACVSLAACGPGGICDPASLEDELAAAEPGDTIELGECVIAGSFEVPAGVIVRGLGAGATIESASGSPALTLDASSGSVTRFENLFIRNASHAALVAIGPGCLELEDVHIDVETGIGIGAHGLECFRATRLEVYGIVTEANAPSFGMIASPGTASTYGLVLLTIAEVALTDVTTSGFAEGGIALRDAPEVALENVFVSGNRHAGLVARSSAIVWRGGGASDTWTGDLSSSAAVSIVDGSIESFDLVIADGQGSGIVGAGPSVHVHSRLSIREMATEGIALEDGTLELHAATIENTTLAGIAIGDLTRVLVDEGTVVRGTRIGRVLVGKLGTIDVGDGIQIARREIVAPDFDVHLEGVTLDENGRAGLLIEGAGASLEGVTLTDVTARASGAAFGVIAQNVAEPRPASWDAEVAREGTASTNDGGFTGELGVLQVQMPPQLPAGGTLDAYLD